ncbi:MAG: chromosomal replication initiator protein DnaA [Alphaproteobacteria bacterium]|nr:chromosomal replication initiator protein DnaA [Alphaproteobacteria bacterium]MBV8548168.1 chromosomal replication initiator protein DnaA [Alphaproteobacteria bacterium]
MKIEGKTAEAFVSEVSQDIVSHTLHEAPESWPALRQALREHFGETAYRRWFENLHASGNDDVMTLKLPTRFMRDWVEAHYGDTIRTLWRQLIRNGRIEFGVSAPILKKPDAAPALNPAAMPGMPAGDALAAPLAAGECDLDPRFTFDNFVVGKPNELAYAAARRVADSDTPGFNPLFLYGGVGLGKTHLMHAIAWHIRRHYPQRRVIYMSAEKFMYQFVRALRYKDTVAFKDQFRSVDVLMIDDVQFIGGKDTTQEEFFHTFNALVDRNRQVIISADKSPQDLDRMEERLRSRLGWGLVADLHPATYELRLGILHAKAEKLGCQVPDKVMEFLAHKITSNVRELEGALNRIAAHAQLVGRTISLEMTQDVLADLLRANDRRITIDEIQKKVAEHYNIRLSDMHSARRARQVARPRQVAMYLAKQLTPRSLPEIGRKFGGRDHTTVIHAVRKIEELSAYDAAFKEDVELLRRLLQG